MSISGPDPIPAIGEADATGDVAALYADIRATLGVPVVNLIWRHLATLPGGLDFAWHAVKPLYESGLVADHARGLRHRLQVPDVQPDRLTGVSVADLELIQRIMTSYERSNAMNLIGLSALLAATAPGGTGTLPALTPLAPESEVSGTLPEATAVSEMPDATRTLALRLKDIGGTDPAMPTMYRHLSHWPGVLQQMLDVLAPLDHAGALRSTISSVVREGRNVGTGLMAENPVVPSVCPETIEAVNAVVSHFVNNMIGKMVVIVAVLRVRFPA